jgi:hypothetical protein
VGQGLLLHGLLAEAHCIDQTLSWARPLQWRTDCHWEHQLPTPSSLPAALLLSLWLLSHEPEAGARTSEAAVAVKGAQRCVPSPLPTHSQLFFTVHCIPLLSALAKLACAHGTAQHGTAQHSTAQHSMAQHSMWCLRQGHKGGAAAAAAHGACAQFSMLMARVRLSSWQWRLCGAAAHASRHATAAEHAVVGSCVSRAHLDHRTVLSVQRGWSRRPRLV